MLISDSRPMHILCSLQEAMDCFWRELAGDISSLCHPQPYIYPVAEKYVGKNACQEGKGVGPTFCGSPYLSLSLIISAPSLSLISLKNNTSYGEQWDEEAGSVVLRDAT